MTLILISLIIIFGFAFPREVFGSIAAMLYGLVLIAVPLAAIGGVVFVLLSMPPELIRFCNWVLNYGLIALVAWMAIGWMFRKR
jgi:hypothetical protein